MTFLNYTRTNNVFYSSEEVINGEILLMAAIWLGKLLVNKFMGSQCHYF